MPRKRFVSTEIFSRAKIISPGFKMIEYILTILIAFAAPVPLWAIVFHLAVEKNSRYRFILYLSIGLAWLLAGYFAFRNRALLFAQRFPSSFPLQILGLGVILAALIIDWQVMKALGFKRLSCMSELKGNASPGALVTAGIYKYARHPRYVEYPLWSLGFALIFGYVFLLWFSFYLFLAFWLVSYFEESELVRRFGEAYREYQRKVPRFFVRLRCLNG